MACCPIGGCRGAAPADGASGPPTRGAWRRTCPEHQMTWGRAGLWHGPTMGWCGHLGPQPNAPMAPTGPPELACNRWGQLGAPLVAWAWLWGCPTPPLQPNSLAPTTCSPQWPCHTDGHGLGLCTWVVHITLHTMHNVPLGTWALLDIVISLRKNRDILVKYCDH